jgi:L-ascorbate metabolism protein UlaG (beta-lactamase superfamily)
MDSLKDERIDYALLPIDGFYTMSPEEATKAAISINPKHMIPMHMKPGMLFDYHQAMKVTAPMAMLMKPNDNIDL